MKQRDILAHQIAASTMDYKQLVGTAEELKNEKDQLSQYLTQSELEEYDILIDIYEKEQKVLISILSLQDQYQQVH